MPRCRHIDEVQNLRAALYDAQNIYELRLRQHEIEIRQERRAANDHIADLRGRMAAMCRDLANLVNSNNRAISQQLNAILAMVNEPPRLNNNRERIRRRHLQDRLRRRLERRRRNTVERPPPDPVVVERPPSPVVVVEESDDDVSTNGYDSVWQEITIARNVTITTDNESSDEGQLQLQPQRRNPVRETRVQQPPSYTEMSDNEEEAREPENQRRPENQRTRIENGRLIIPPGQETEHSNYMLLNFKYEDCSVCKIKKCEGLYDPCMHGICVACFEHLAYVENKKDCPVCREDVNGMFISQSRNGQEV